ncbi:hypothetical protein EU527_01925 [Candidatus Thorarchaeota archaeon]|nr:MAG: hypothetical protein EU527_01925 [Candidatus Thorarchaeota archaeon]
MSTSTMIRFIQILPQVSEKGNFLLKDLPGSGKRIDILCRDLAACFDWGPIKWPKSQLEFIAVLKDSKILQFQNPKENLPRGERAWAEVIHNSLKNNPPEFVYVSDGNLESIIEEYDKPPQSRVWVLCENGGHIGECKFNIPESQNSFMLGDHRGFDSNTEELASKYNLWKVSLGKISYLSSHCVVSIISEFERMV